MINSSELKTQVIDLTKKSLTARRFALFVSALHMLCLSLPANAQTPVSSPTISQVPTSSPSDIVPSGTANLNPSLKLFASFTGALNVMKEIESLQSDLKNIDLAASSPMAYMSKRQKFVYLRGKLNSILETSNLEVNSTRGHIELLMSQVQTQQAKMVEKRARTLRRNTIINFVSGGITKLAGYSIALGGADTPSNILEIFDGGVQCTLSGTVIKDLHSESLVVGQMPEMLTQLSKSDDPNGIYARQVWDYLNEPANGVSGQPRRVDLTSDWQNRGFFDRHTKASSMRENSALTGKLALARITPQLLDDRLAMLSELRSVVSEMHTSLMKLSLHIKQSYADDPSFDWPLAAN
ncbi:MAG: hypothetical protein C0507_15285 [Cyanobacteria bacterium PR.3.49]|nr:hypothetical protein [Cyanobacteria bacterium PR.3.49]